MSFIRNMFYRMSALSSPFMMPDDVSEKIEPFESEFPALILGFATPSALIFFPIPHFIALLASSSSAATVGAVETGPETSPPSSATDS